MHTPPMAAITGLALSSTVLITVKRCGCVAALRRAEFANVGAAGETGAGADQHDGVRPQDRHSRARLPSTIAWRNSRPRLLTGGLSNVRTAMPSLISKPALFVLILYSTLQNWVPSFWPTNVTAQSPV